MSFAERGDACRGAADAEKATGKIDWVHYMLSRDGDTASAVTVPVTFDGFAGNDWNLDAAKRTHQSQVRGRERHRHAERQAGPGFRSLGFSNTATLSGTLRMLRICLFAPGSGSAPRRLWGHFNPYCPIKAAVLWFVACSYALVAVDRQNPGIRCARRHEGSLMTNGPCARAARKVSHLPVRN